MFGRSIVNLLGASAVLGALIAAAMPMGLNAVDRAGAPIPCGNGLRPSYEVAAKQDQLNLDQATLAGPAYVVSDYTAQCTALITERRTVAASVGGAGVALVLAGCCAPHVARRLSAVRASRRGRKAQHAGAAEAVRYQPHHAAVRAQRGADEVGAGITQPILEESVGKQVGRHSYAAVAAAALRGDGIGNTGGAGGGIGQFYAIAGHS